MLDQIPTRPHPLTRYEGKLAPLGEMLSNYAWTWRPKARALIESLDPEMVHGNASPIRLLANPEKREQLEKDKDFIKRLNAAHKDLTAYLSQKVEPPQGVDPAHPVSYFCAEYGLHESFPQYCGGLGILAGDHVREASDMGLPFVGVGLFYRLGFFRQALEPDGRQQHVYERFDPLDHPLERVLKPGTEDPLTVSIDLPGRTLHAAVWRLAMGRVPLLLLDTDLPENRRSDRPVSAQLYMRGRRMRFVQEMLLGIGGARALAALGIDPCVYHMNEGHSALLLVEQLARQTEEGKSWKEAQAAVREHSILTIHTPVPAGNERFDAKMAAELLEPTLKPAKLNDRRLRKLALDSESDKKVFDMTAFALRLSKAANGVSLLHGQTADGTWRPVVKRPVGAVTNGVHPPTWVGPEMRTLLEKTGYPVGEPDRPPLHDRPDKRAEYTGLDTISDEELTQAHRARKEALVAFASERLLRQYEKHGVSPEELEELAGLLNPDAFLIGFARRFTAYKRPALLWSYPKRLRKLLENSDRPVQIIFSGKAHPLDGEGQAMVAEMARLAESKRWRGKVFYLEEYDMAVGRHLTQGVDLWINNPLRPLEASGTSGMKAAMNGVPNASVLDGWWDEGYEGDNGWAVGARKPRKNRPRQDRFDATSLFDLLEDEILPMYGTPEWTQVMRRVIATSAWAFSTRRMLIDYVDSMIVPDPD